MATFQSVLRFNGKDNLIEIPYAAPVKPSQFTVSCWARVQGGQGTWRTAGCWRDDSDKNRYSLYADKDGQWYFYIEGVFTKCVSGSTVTLNAWTHLAGTYDGTKITLYVNGDLVAQKDAAFTPYIVSRVQIGSFGGWYNFAGELTEVYFWNRARPQEEIQQDMYRGLEGNELGLLGYWPLNEGSGNTVFDKSSNRNNGTIKGATWQQQIFIKSPDSAINYFSSSLRFNGVNDHIVLPAMNVDYSRGITVEAWVRYNSFKNLSRIIDFGNGAPNANIVLCNGQKTNQLWFYVYKGKWFEISVDGVLEIGKWMHLAATVDVAGKAKIYVNGQLIKSGDLTLPESINRTLNYIGKSNWSTEEFFDGQITEVRLWNRDRSQQQLQQNLYRRLAGNEPSLVGYWPLNEGSGSTVVSDKSVSAKHGMINTGATWQQSIFWETGLSSSLRFNGVSDHIVLPAMNVDYSRGLTVEAWVRYNSFKDWSRIIEFGNGVSNSNITFGNRETKNGLVFQLWKGNQNAAAMSADQVLETGKWMHVAATVDASGKGKLYVNGQQIQTVNLALPETLNRTLNYIGKSSWTGDNFFDGQIAEVRLWNRDCSQQELQQNLYRRLAGNEANLVGYWPLNEGSGTTIGDKTKGSNQGTIKGATWEAQVFLQPNDQPPFQSILTFDGQDDLVEGAFTAPLNPSKISLSCWVKAQGQQDTWRCAIAFTGGEKPYRVYSFYATDKNKWSVYIGPIDDQDNWMGAVGNSNLTLNVWTHLAATYDGSKLKLYVNGTVSAETERTYAGFTIGKVLIGAIVNKSSGSLQNFFPGEITEVRIWNRVLSKEEIEKDIDSRLVGNEQGLVGYWSLNEGAGSTVRDKSSMGHHAQIKGATWQQQILPSLVAQKAAAEKALADKALAEKAAAEAKAAADKALAEKAAAEKAAKDAQNARDKAVSEKTAAENAKTAAESAAKDAQNARDKAVSEKTAAESAAKKAQDALNTAVSEKAAAEAEVAKIKALAQSDRPYRVTPSTSLTRTDVN